MYLDKVLNKKYFLISLGIHLVIILLLVLATQTEGLKKTFIVFGAHSGKNSRTGYKPMHKFIPFMHDPNYKKRNGRNGSHSNGRVNGHQNGNIPHSSTSGAKQQSKKALALMQKRKHSQKIKLKTLQQKRHKLLALADIQKNKHKQRPIKKHVIKPTPQTEIVKESSKSKKRKEELKRKKFKKKLLAIKALMKPKIKKVEPEPEPEKPEEILKEEPIKKQETKPESPKKPVEELKEKETESEPEPEKLESNRSEPIEPEQKATESVESGHEDGHAEQFDEQEPSFDLMAEGTPELEVYRRDVQREVVRLWRPPLGVAKGTTCRVKFSVGTEGEIDKFEIVSNSPMLIYDLSIMRVAKQFKFTQYLWGKSFTIDFRQ